MNFWWNQLFIVCLAGVCLGEYTRTVSYQGDVLVKCSGLQPAAVQHLLETVDVWHVGEEGSVDFRVSREQFQRLKGDLPECREEGSVEDLVKTAEQAMFSKRVNGTQQEWFEEYHRYGEIVDWWKKLADDNPNLAEFVTIGKSLEGRDVPAIHISTQVGSDLKRLYLQCQIHAREWISGAVCMYIANELVERFNSGDERVKKLLDESVFIFVPTVNPDGYEFTWTDDRLWRKNRSPPPTGSGCYGVDLNRNYDDHWAGGGSSGNPCSETYHGPSAASEIETQNSQNYFLSGSNIVAAIDWHSFSQLILRPYGWTTETPPDETQLKEMGDKMSEDIFAVEGKRYTSQRAVQLYMGTGTALDWFYSDDGNMNNNYRAASYVFELRDEGQYGFLLPPDQIIPCGKEIVPAVLNFAETVIEKPLNK